MVDAATKDDIRAVKDDIREAKSELQTEIRGVRTEMRGIRDELRGEIRAVGVMVEHIDAKVDAVIEGLTSTREELKRDMASMEERLLGRMTMIEQVVRENSADIARQSDEIRRLTGDTRSIHQEILGLRVDMTNKLVSKEAHAELEARTTALEKKLGIKS